MKSSFQPLKARFQDSLIEAGIDEAGRGCLAGPVVAAAVIFPPNFNDPELNDSKKLTATQREKICERIKSNAFAWAIGVIDNVLIDEINILQATYQAMHDAIDQLSQKPELLLVDGNRFKPYPGIPFRCFIKGDGRFQSIAAASILAKTHRDALMQEMHLKYPCYGWDQNKGYPTKFHRQAIKKNGISPLHRISFQLLPPLSLFD
ncbi:MAG: ribonuclease HII [Bacteroidota bacterium]|nr:ribonuclease HII [Bacteroidota bacterium]